MNTTEHYYQVTGRDSDSSFEIEIQRGKPDAFTDNKIQLRIEKEDDQVYANCSIDELKQLREAIDLVINELEGQ